MNCGCEKHAERRGGCWGVGLTYLLVLDLWQLVVAFLVAAAITEHGLSAQFAYISFQCLTLRINVACVSFFLLGPRLSQVLSAALLGVPGTAAHH